MTKMVVGLGNPGVKYAQTKHNIGFMTIDYLLEKYANVKTTQQNEAEVSSVFVDGEKVLFVKPLTFMNDSGRAVGPLCQYYKVEMDDLTVIYDDMDLPAGKIRLRQKGSAGGHNGIKSLIAHLGTEHFNRIRIGIDHPHGQQSVVDHVLSRFSAENEKKIETGINEAAKACDYWLDQHLFMETMNRYNHK